jgi:hypothetical protein
MTSNPQLEAFLRTVKADPALLERFHTAACLNDIAAQGEAMGTCLNDIAAQGEAMGFHFTGVDILVHQAEATLRLPAEALEALAAGVELEGHLWKMAIQWS